MTSTVPCGPNLIHDNPAQLHIDVGRDSMVDGMPHEEKPRTPRFRIVLEILFEDANPCDPSGSSNLLSRWAEFLGNNSAFRCKDVKLRETLTIGDVDDYTDWRRGRGAYDISTWPAEGMGYVRRRKNDTES